ncbi:hypothetical protein KGF56_001228 [Candida oxycetoniae]|uniref:Mitochondrial inner membrane i-AAA protease supercomplex subunit MGR3 n=1 Tax=Candida oxycetoniae TaxID=497107 RepID=A0AAI9WZF7_9ASCO|nr:uncharacterized protein KGF56_001228 [Candida oxycetoniae]KAI3406009.2 hypothetical protein KGF56_001228 [Candida oxycetoniae]
MIRRLAGAGAGVGSNKQWLRRQQSLRYGGRRYTQYSSNYGNQQYAGYMAPKPSLAKKLGYTALGLACMTAYAYYMWWPKHTFPKSVAKILRKGLWAESDRGEYDYQLALKYYLEALEHCKEIGIDPLSDEYTGIQLKIGEMFERLNMLSDAAFVYNEIATLYLSVLAPKPDASKKSEKTRIKNREHRRHLIQKDLRIAIKLVELNKANPQLCKAILVTHIVIAQDEVNKLLDNRNELSLITKGRGGGGGGGGDNESQKNFTAMLDNDAILINDDEGQEVARIKKRPEVWEPFTDEFFNAMDLLSAICISTGDLAMASKVKIVMTEDMLLADVEPSKMLLSQCNLGSLLYMQAEELEAREIAMKRNFSEVAGVEYEAIKNNQDIVKDEELQTILKEKVPLQDQEAYDRVTTTKNTCFNLAIKSYESVLQFAKSIPQEIVKEHNEIKETVALATYGLGVINLHLSKYDKAERLLRESRVRSKACDYKYLIPEIERELNKLFQERKNVESGQPVSKDNVKDIEMDIHIT